jgi:hypothetical protein
MATIPNPPGQTPDPNAPQNKTKTDWPKVVKILIYGAIGLLILGVIIWGLSGQQGFLESVSDRTVARGLITFLITFTTIGIAVMLAISTIFSGSDGDEEKRFDRGKQVLSVLIGLLGTIVGFYFGSSPDSKATTAAVQQQTLAIAPAAISNSQPKKGEKITISSFVSGGKAPYIYSITFDPPLLSAVKDAKSPEGVIREEVAVPDTLASDAEVKFQIAVRDSENKTADYNKDGAQKISLKVK